MKIKTTIPTHPFCFYFFRKVSGSIFVISFMILWNSFIYSQSSTCQPGMVENNGSDNWSEECYLNDECAEQGNPCQANDVTMLGAYIADLSGGPITTFIPGEVITFALWGTFYNNTGTNRYAVRSRTEFYRDGLFEMEMNDCSFDLMPSGNSNSILLDGFSFQSGELVQLLNTWVGWSTTAAQCSDPIGEDYSSECGHYPPAKCSKELGFIEILAPNFSFACQAATSSLVEVCFTNLSAGGTHPLVYDWDFGDGNSSTEESPCHVYEFAEGEFTCLLSVTDDKGVVAEVQALIDLEELSCCSLVYECPPGFEGIMQCVEEIPAAAPEAIEIIESCGPVNVTYIEELVGAGCPGDPITLTRSYIISDDVNSDTCTQSYTVADLVQPVLICPDPVTVSCASLVPAPDVGTVITEENCDSSTVTFLGDVISNQICNNNFVITRTYQAEDGCGNISTCTQLITVSDQNPPTITCQADLTVSCPDDVPAADIEAIVTTDGCGGEVNITVAADVIIDQTCTNEYIISRVYTATDECGNTATCVQYITVADLSLPIISCPADITLSCQADIPAPDISAVITSDNCEGEVTVTVSSDVILNDICENQFSISRVYTATDACGNTATCEQIITVQDNIQPDISCPADITVSCASDIPVPDIEAIVVTDNCEGDIEIVVSEDIVTDSICPGQFVTERVYIATDACGNSASCSQIITVSDDLAPEITCVGDITVSCAGDIPLPDVSMIIATDNCEGDVTVTVEADVISGEECINGYTISRTYIATDACGNTSSCIQTITISDETGPIITCPENIEVSCLTTVPEPDVDLIFVEDNCVGNISVIFSGDATIDSTCINQLSIERMYIAIDACGNTSSCIQEINVMDDVPPVLICPEDITVACAGDVPVPDLALPDASDACEGEIIFTVLADVTMNQSCTNSFEIQRTYIATDACGNSSSCTQIITVSDNIPPAITCLPDVTVECTENIPAVDINNIEVQDNCDGEINIEHVGDSVVNQICENNYSLLRTYRATDECGNFTDCIQAIVVNDQTAPLITCPTEVNVSCAWNVPAVDTASVSFSDNCGGNIEISHTGDIITDQTCENRFTITRSYLASDDCGNTSGCTQLIFVYDSLPPEIVFTDQLLENLNDGDTLYTQCYGQNPEWEVPDFSIESVAVEDNCGDSVTVDHTSELVGEGDCAEDGFIVMYRHVWTAVDACGNSDSVTVYVKLIDSIPPVIVGVPEDVTVSWDSIPALPDLFATDECLCACVVLVEETPLDSTACLDGQVITRTWKATDACGNMMVETQQITIIDVDGPQMQLLLPDLTGIADGDIIEFTCAQGGIPASIQQMDGNSIVALDANGVVTTVFNKNLVEPVNCELSGFLEEKSYTWSAIDQCGNTSGMTITARLMDNVAPSIQGLPDMACIADPILNDVEAVDDCGEASLRYWEDQIDNPCSEGLITMRIYEAQDNCGNILTDTILLFPDDEAKPVMEFIHPDLIRHDTSQLLIVNCAAHNGLHSPYGPDDVIVSDACSENVTVTFTERMLAPEDCSVAGSMGVMELQWMAEDLCGNATSMTIMARLIDTTAPSFIGLEKEITISCLASLPPVSALDNCAEARVVTIDSIIPGPCVYEYDVLRTLIATDGCNNSTIQKQLVHVGDQKGPVIDGVEEVVCDDLYIPHVTAFDVCAGVFVPVTMNQDTLEELCKDALIIERTWSATDACNHTAEITQTIIMGDSIPPQFSVPAYSIIYDYIDLDSIPQIMFSQVEILNQLSALDANSVFVIDNCHGELNPEFTFVREAMSDDEGSFERWTFTWMATDYCGNLSTLDFSVDIIDDTPPILELPGGDTVVICAPLPPAPEMIPEDSTAVVTYTESIENGPNPGEYLVTRTWLVTDAVGNTSVTVQKIKWIPDSFVECDIILPDSVECNSHGVIITSDVTGGFPPYTYDWEIIGDECFIQGGQNTPEIIIYVGWGDVYIRLTVTDAFGCVTVCEDTLECDASNPGFAVYGHNFNSQENNSVPSLRLDTRKDFINSPQIWPNPTTGEVNLNFGSSSEYSMKLSVIDLTGKVLMQEDIDVLSGINNHIINARDLPAGIYKLQLLGQHGVYSENLVILDH
jgi:large repetitive protein